MFLRSLMLAGGLAGAVALSQFPEFSQQYTQRLAGKVDELTRFVAEFDADAAQVGFSREQALVDLAGGSAIGAERAQTMVATMARQKRLARSLDLLRDADALSRIRYVRSFTDGELLGSTWSDFKPALPVTSAGLVFAAMGFLTGLIGVTILTGLLRILVRPIFVNA